jgi:triosephosphate isomerase
MPKLIIANWKLNPATEQEAKALAQSIARKSPHTVVLCPPPIFLTTVKYPNLGSQDCFWQTKGPFTGQISPLQLKSSGISYCIVGHSEKRLEGESDSQINKKIQILLDYKIIPVFCIGYGTTIKQDELEVVDVLKQQLKAGLGKVNAKKVVVSYEPVWAIGSGRTAKPEHAEQIAMFIKNKFGVAKVLYGGSVNSTNSNEFLNQRHIDGLLVGGASLLPEDFNKIIG